MRILVSVVSVPLLLALLIGCAASSDKTAAPPEPALSPPPAAPAAAAQKSTTPASQDTVSVAVQKTQKPAYESTDPVKTEVPPPAPATPARFGVQIGAYKLPENAEAVAASAKLRFARTIYTLRDDATGLVKVVIGDFSTKEEARAFRDRMAQQYPGDYKDAWVSDIAK